MTRVRSRSCALAIIATLVFSIAARSRVRAQAPATAGVQAKRPCAGLGQFDAVVVPAFDDLLLADAVVHIRIAEDGQSREVGNGSPCWTVSEARADVLRVLPLARPAPFPMTTILTSHYDWPLVAGREYVALVNYRTTAPPGVIVHFEDAREVSHGRVRARDEDDLRLRDGMTVDRALESLLGTYRRYTRYRDERPRGLGALSRKTGWIELGVVARGREVWPEGQPFEYAADAPPPRIVPQPKDRIRLKQDASIVILDFGATGEASWKRSPASRHGDLHLSDHTGARAEAGEVYTVMDVQFEPAAEEGLQFVWVRLVAAP